ncbi:MAG: hypothetical protein NTW25_05345 [Candidatus Kapabacteria bacterium]|nr:hypothetical protein [Candidatus Kapabacteria bacterium]
MFKQALKIGLSFVFLLTIFSTQANSQVKVLTSFDSLTCQINGFWYNLAYDQFQVKYHKPAYLPPLSTDMNYETLLSYIFLDSLLRTVDYKTLNTNYFTRWSENKLKNDTILSLIKYIYKIIDYDPIKFTQYGDAADGKYYKMSASNFKSKISQLYDALNHTLNSPAMLCLLNADYILRVHINTIDSLPMLNSKGQLRNGSFRFNANATVIDTLKGRVFKQCSYNNTSIQKDKNNQTQDIYSNICFSFCTGNQTREPYLLEEKTYSGKKDLTFKQGQDVIIFLEHSGYLQDYQNDYYNLTLYKAIPIINGQAKDLKKTFSNFELLNYSDWKNAFLEKVNMLLTGGY